MGVPGLFSNLIREYQKNEVIKKIIPNDDPNHLYLDFNCAIYTAFNANIIGIKTEEALILHTIEYLETLCRVIPNLELIYIAIDGVPPFGKCIQQRQRRFHSICKKNRTNKINEMYGNVLDIGAVNNDIDLNMITPGTPFMAKLGIAIKNAIKNNSGHNINNVFKGKKVFFSDASIPGEGEHKIMKHLRDAKHLAVDGTEEERILYGADHNTIIYGLDADLINLSLIQHIPNMYLFREANEYGHLATSFEGKKYLFMDIDELKGAVIESFRKYYPGLDIMKVNKYINDYVFLGMLLGNDFMPKCHWFSLHSGGYDIFISAYFQVHNHTELFLVNADSLQINTEMLADIWFLIKNQEQDKVVALFEKRKRARIHVKEEMTERERQQLVADCYPLQHLYVEQQIEPAKPNWQARYYKICLNMDKSEPNLQTICQAYLKTLVWNFMYYFNECPSWDWYYSYPYAPTFTDIYNELLQHRNINNFTFGKTAPLDQQTLLCCVLPFASRKYMIRDVSAKLVSEKCALRTYFPKRYGINVAFHNRYHECTPIIPNIDIEKVKKFIKECKMTEDEYARNLVGKLFIV